MYCRICNTQHKSNVCENCGFIEAKRKFKGLKKLSLELDSVITFLKYILKINNLDSFISKKEYTNIIDENISNFFSKLNNNNDLKDYCKKYNFNISNVLKYLDIINNFDNYIKNINKKYLNKMLEVEKDYLDNVLKKIDNNLELDKEQREVVLSDEDYTLVIAGAGAGKTTTIAAKVKYLVDKKNINPKDILVISYTNKAVEELKDRINKRLEIFCPISTFHQAGRSITKKDDSTANTKVVSDNYYIINKYLSSLIFNEHELLSKLILLFGCYFEIPEELITNKEDYFTYKEKADYTTLKSNLNEVAYQIIDKRKKAKITINSEFLRPMEEVRIANFLYLHNIEYRYEYPYKYRIQNSKKIYTPDFYIKQNDLYCYIEHFGISEDGFNSRYTKEELETYKESIKTKIALHKKYNTSLITTYSKYNDGTDLIFNLEKQLKEKGFVLKRKDDLEVYKKIIQSEKDKYVSRFSNIASRFISLFKTRGYNETQFQLMKAKSNNPRVNLFIDVLENVYLYYQNYLKVNNQVDFEDMINESTRLLKEMDLSEKIKFKYIIIDEFQDISRQRFELVKELVRVSEAKLIAVGDDRQSIYAFAGSEIKLFIDFTNITGYANLIRITHTYRNAQELIDIAGKFIQKNDFQIKKSLISNKVITKPIVCFSYDDAYKNEKKGIKGIEYERAKTIVDIIEKIIKVDGISSKILLIGRFNFEESKLIETGFFKKNYNKLICVKYPKANLTYLTAHSSKGLTYDNVIIINAKHEVYGFPAQIEDDPVFNLVTFKDNTIDFSEERRLFYVALTRTKNRVFITVPENRPSKFIIELIEDFNITKHGEISSFVYEVKKNRKYCHKCGYPLDYRKNTSFGLDLYICTNEPEVCGFMTNNIKGNGNIHYCSLCDGYLIVRKVLNKDAYFFGCTNYKEDGTGCNNVEKIELT